MTELNLKDLEKVSGGFDWKGRRMSTNVIDMRSGYAHTPLPRFPRTSVPNPFAHYRQTGWFW